MKKHDDYITLFLAWVGIVLLIILLGSCSLIKVVPQKMPDKVPDTVITYKVDTIPNLQQRAELDSLARVIDLLNTEWVKQVNQESEYTMTNDLSDYDLTKAVNYWKDKSFQLRKLTEQQSSLIREQQGLLNKLKDQPPSTVTTIERTVTKSGSDSHTELKMGIAAIIAYIIGLFTNKKKQ